MPIFVEEDKLPTQEFKSSIISSKIADEETENNLQKLLELTGEIFNLE